MKPLLMALTAPFDFKRKSFVLALFLILFVAGLTGALVFKNLKVQVPYRTALMGTKLNSFDPAGIGGYHEITFFSQICGRLASVDEAMNIEGDLASSWEITENGLLYVFRLHTNRRFVDGTQVTARDVVASLERAKQADLSMVTKWTPEIDSLKVRDAHTLEIRLNTANPRFLYKMSNPRFCILNAKRPFLEVQNIKIPNSSGAYTVAGFEGSKILLSVTSDFAARAIEKQIEVSFLTQAEAIEAFKRGELDDLSFYLLSPAEISSLSAVGRKLRANLFWSWTLFINPHSTFFADPKARRAFVSKIAFDELYASEWGSSTLRSTSVIPEGMLGHVTTNLKSLGDSNGSSVAECLHPLKILAIHGMPFSQDLERTIKSAVQSATGCPVTFDFSEMGDIVKARLGRTADMYLHGLDTNSTDPLGFYRYFYGASDENHLGVKDEAFDSLYLHMEAQQPRERSIGDYQALQDRFYSAGFGVVIGQPVFTFIYAKNVKDVHMNPLGMHLNRWWKIGR